MKKIYKVIRTLGVTTRYKGYYFLADAVTCVMRTPEMPLRVTKDIYPMLAAKFKSKPTNIEHDIRTVINICYTTNREKLEEIFGRELNFRPSNSEFIDIMAFYLMRLEEEEEAKKIAEKAPEKTSESQSEELENERP